MIFNSVVDDIFGKGEIQTALPNCAAGKQRGFEKKELMENARFLAVALLLDVGPLNYHKAILFAHVAGDRHLLDQHVLQELSVAIGP